MMLTFLLGLVLGALVGVCVGGLLVFKHYRPALRATYEFLDQHAPRDQTEAIARRLVPDPAAAG